MNTKLKLKKSLLASTCLTAITLSGANAAIVNESSVPGGDFSNGSGAAPTSLAAGTTQVNGAILGSVDFADFFSIPGFTPGTSVNVSMTGTGATSFLQVYTGLDLDAPITAISNSEGAAVTVTSTGLLAFGSNTEGSQGTYSVFISAPPPTSVPVAPSAALLGVGVAAIGLRRRKHGVAK